MVLHMLCSQLPIFEFFFKLHPPKVLNGGIVGFMHAPNCSRPLFVHVLEWRNFQAPPMTLNYLAATSKAMANIGAHGDTIVPG